MSLPLSAVNELEFVVHCFCTQILVHRISEKFNHRNVSLRVSLLHKNAYASEFTELLTLSFRLLSCLGDLVISLVCRLFSVRFICWSGTNLLCWPVLRDDRPEFS